MQMAHANAQSGLTALERGKHASLATTKYKHNGSSITAYAQDLKRPKQSVDNELLAYEVYAECPLEGTLRSRVQTKFKHLVAIHAALKEHWLDLCERMCA